MIPRKSFLTFFLALLPALFFLGTWEFLVHHNQRLQFLFASPLLVAHVAWEDLPTLALWHHIFVTAEEAVLGLLCGTVLGTLAGLLLWGNGRADFILRPYVAFIAAVPIFALAPMTIIWFGIGLMSKVVMAGFAVFFISLTQSYEGARAVAVRYLGFARSLGASNGRIIRKIIIPGAIEWVVTGYKMNVGAALTGAFIGEFVSSEGGLGHYILKASALYDTPRVLFGLFLLCLLGVALISLARLADHRQGRNILASFRMILPSQTTMRQFLKFGIVGLFGFGVDASMLYVGIDGLGLSRVTAGFFSFPFAVTATWIGNRFFTFRTARRDPLAKQWAKFAFVCAIGLLFNRGTYSLTVSLIPLVWRYPVMGLLAGTAAGMFFNFHASRKHVFERDALKHDPN